MLDDIKTEEFWDDTLNKMKEGVVSSIDQYITSYEEEIRKMDSRRLQPGWNYYGFFFLKVSQKKKKGIRSKTGKVKKGKCSSLVLDNINSKTGKPGIYI